ncbi:Asp-tRNA(Asn)/Glu-tRNA(Gln) amidotransferase subunit GatA [Patescibacteria group bacterium]
MDLKNLTIKKAHEAMKNGDFTARELTESYIAEIEKSNPEINAYLEVFEDALTQADEADKRIKDGNGTELTGIPIAIKDNILIKGKIASAASKMLENYKATYDAHVIEKLKDAGAVLIGRTNMDEFAMGGSTENSAFGVTKNPHDTQRVPGGSSGGSAAALAMDGSLIALGSDTGGSIRQPASFCGVVGLKPTYGAVSRRGVMAMGSSLDQIGPFAKTVEDAEILFDVIKGHDPKDSTSAQDSFSDVDGKENKMTIGVPEDFVYAEGVDEDVKENFKQTLKKLEEAGHRVKNISIPSLKYSLAAYYIIMPAESSTNLTRYDGVRYGLHVEGEDLLADYMKTRGEGFGKEVRRRIMLGTYVLSAGYYDAYYNKATAVRDMIRLDYQKAFKDVDVIVTPTSPTPAFKIGEKSDDPLQMYLTDIFTVSANITGLPAISVPSGFADRDGKKLPLGFQITAPLFEEKTLFNLGKDIESTQIS